MPERIRDYRPGQQPTSRDLNGMREDLAANAFTWGDGLLVDPGIGGTRMSLPPDRLLWIRLTGDADGAAYGWEEIVEDEGGEWAVPADGQTGASDSYPAYTAGKAQGLPEGTIGLARVAGDGQSVRFVAAHIPPSECNTKDEYKTLCVDGDLILYVRTVSFDLATGCFAVGEWEEA